MFLTEPELVEMTGWRRRSKQVAWLRRMGVPHYVRRDGRPVVVRAELERRSDTPKRVEPDFSAAARRA